MQVGKRDQAQEAGDNSINYQAGKDIHVHGISIDEARTVALDVFRSNALELAGVAQTLALARAEQLTNEFLTKLETEIPERVDKLADPDVQSVVFQAQREFARSGEDDLRVALVDLLATRVGEDDRNLRTLALNEAISSAPKLTEQQRRAIAWVFYLRYTRATNLGTPEEYYVRLKNEVSALGVSVPTGYADYQHIEYVGAGSLGLNSPSFASVVMSGVEGFYTNGFTVSDIDSVLLAELRERRFVIPALRDSSHFQFNLIADEELETQAVENGLEGQIQDLKNLVNLGRMSEDEVVNEVIAKVPELTPLRDTWDNSKTGLRSLTLTSVGLALGHAYWSRLTGSTSSLKLWLP